MKKNKEADWNVYAGTALVSIVVLLAGAAMVLGSLPGYPRNYFDLRLFSGGIVAFVATIELWIFNERRWDRRKNPHKCRFRDFFGYKPFEASHEILQAYVDVTLRQLARRFHHSCREQEEWREARREVVIADDAKKSPALSKRDLRRAVNKARALEHGLRRSDGRVQRIKSDLREAQDLAREYGFSVHSSYREYLFPGAEGDFSATLAS